MYTRIFTIGHLLLSISNLTTYEGEILRLSSRMEASRRSGHVPLCTLPSLGRHPRLTHKIFLLFRVRNGLCGSNEIHVPLCTLGFGNLLPLTMVFLFVASWCTCARFFSLVLLGRLPVGDIRGSGVHPIYFSAFFGADLSV